MRPQAWQINGTLKEDDKGVDPATWGNTAAKGALFNPSRGSGAASGLVTMDDEYASFMAELGGGGPPAPPKIDSAELAAQVQTKPPRTPLPYCGVHCCGPETPLWWPSRGHRRRGANLKQRAG